VCASLASGIIFSDAGCLASFKSDCCVNFHHDDRVNHCSIPAVWIRTFHSTNPRNSAARPIWTSAQAVAIHWVTSACAIRVGCAAKPSIMGRAMGKDSESARHTCPRHPISASCNDALHHLRKTDENYDLRACDTGIKVRTFVLGWICLCNRRNATAAFVEATSPPGADSSTYGI